MKLTLAENLSLPIDAVTQTFAILAKRGVGKSYLAAVLAEEMLTAELLTVIIDPTGAHYGLRSSADGKAPGFPIVVLGGDHADLPLEEHAGEIVAASIVEHRFPAIIDLSLFRKAQATRFMVSFLETLYRLNRDALHLIVDEADTFAPQRVMGEDARVCGAMGVPWWRRNCSSREMPPGDYYARNKWPVRVLPLYLVQTRILRMGKKNEDTRVCLCGRWLVFGCESRD